MAAGGGPGDAFSAINPFGMGSVSGVPGALGQMLGGGAAGVFSLGNYAQMGGDGPGGVFGGMTGPTDMGAIYTGVGAVPGMTLSSAVSRMQTNAMAASVSYYHRWNEGWESYIMPGTLLFPVKNIVLSAADGGPPDVVEQGGIMPSHAASSMGQRFLPASIPVINWLLEESARNMHKERNAPQMLSMSERDAIARRKWVYVDNPLTALATVRTGDKSYARRTQRFYDIFGRVPLLEVNRGPAYDDNPMGGYDAGADYGRSERSKRARGYDHPHLVAVPKSDGFVCNTPNIWGSPVKGCKLTLRLRYYDSRAGTTAAANPFGVFMGPDGKTISHAATTDTGFLQLVPNVYLPNGEEDKTGGNVEYGAPHNSRTDDPEAGPLPTDLDWLHNEGHNPETDYDGDVKTYQRGLQILVGTVKETPVPFDITSQPAPLRNHKLYNSLPRVSILFGV